MKNIKLIKKWAKLKHIREAVCLKIYKNQNHIERGKFMIEVRNYLHNVELGIIKVSKLDQIKKRYEKS